MSQSAAIRSVTTAAAHTIGSHSDVSGVPARGDIYVRSAAGLWVPKTLGASGAVLRSDGADPQWSTDGSALTALSAAALASGTVPDARFPATLPAASGVNLTAIPETAITDGALLARLADNETVAGTWGFTPGLKERGRTVAIGEWTDVAYDAANFTVVSGTGTWTVAAGDQGVYAYTLVGKTLTVIATLDATSVTTTVLFAGIAVPGGFASAKHVWGIAYLYDNSSTVFSVATAQVLAAGTVIRVFKSDQSTFLASANNTYLRVLIVIPVA